MYQCSKHQPSKLRIKDVIFCLSVGNITEVRTVTTQPKTWTRSKVIIGRSKHGKKKSGAIFSERYFGDIGYLFIFLLGEKFKNTCMYTFDVLKVLL